MVCSFPPPLIDDQLTTVLDGEADTSLQEHIDGCQYCRSRMEQAKSVEGALHGQLQRWDCPKPQQLGDYMLALLPQAEERGVMRHLEQCALCATEYADLRSFMAEEAVVPLAPTMVPERSAGLRFGERLARLMPRKPALALRGGAGAGPLMAEAGGVTIVLDVQAAAADRVDVMGQVVADDQDAWIGALVELRSGAQLHGMAEVDDLGGFSYSGVPAGSATVRVTSAGGQSVLVQDLELGA